MTLPGLEPSADLSAVLARRASNRPDRPVYTFLADGESEAERLTSGELERKARALATALAERGLGGERVLLLYPAGLDFVVAFWGCLLAGAVAVPAYPPRPGQGPERLARLAEDARPRAVLGPASTVRRRRRVAAGVPRLAALPWLATDELLAAGEAELARAWRAPDLTAESLAFLQYTSGSTAAPKGVMVTHGNLLHNLEMIRGAFGQSEDSVVVSWLPVYHDMGLVGGLLQPLYSGGRCVLLSPTAFLKRPVRWLEAIARHRATTSGGPDFAYDLCARKVSEAEARSLDLSSWEVAFDGAEPVRADTLDRFAERFVPQGFRRRAFRPCYGLAEATLLVTVGAPGGGPAVLEVAREELARGRAAPPAGGSSPGVRRVVGCGGPWLDQEVVIVDPETRRRVDAGRAGEVWVAGPSVARGYWGKPEETEGTFRARRADDPAAGPYLRTGDLGFLAGGELVIAGRRKDLIVLRGLNHHPQDLERSAEGAHPELVPGGGAAFAVAEDDGGERLVTVLEVERRRDLDEAAAESVAEAVRRALAREHGVAVTEVVLVRRGGVPRTSSGKVRRRACRELHLAGRLPVLGRSVEAVEPGAAAAVRALSREELEALPAGERPGAVLELLRHEVARLARLPASRVDTARPLVELGLDSLTAAELARVLEESLGIEAAAVDLLSGTTLEDAAALALASAAGAPAAAEALSGPLPGGRETGHFPLSWGQRALWFLHRLAPRSSAYHLAGAVRVRGELDVAALAGAVRDLIRRHPSLRTTLVEHGGEPRQYVAAWTPGAFGVVEVRSPEDGGRPAASGDPARELAEAPFDLASGPLFRLAVLRRPGGPTRLVFVLHHAVADFGSVAVMLRDLATFYARRRGLPAPALPALVVTPADVARWQAERLAGPRGEALAEHWRRALTPPPPPLAFPTDRPRPPVRSFAGGCHGARLGAPLASGVRALARGSGTTPYTVLLAGLLALLHRWSGQDDLVVGSPTAGRDAPGLADLVGYLADPVVLRSRLDGDLSFRDLLGAVRDTALRAFAHRDLPFARLIELLQPERDPGRSPLFDVLFAFETARPGGDADGGAGLAALALGQAGPPIPFADLALEPLPLAPAGAPFDLTLVAAEVGDDLALSLRYDAALFDAPTAARAAGHLATLLAAAVAEPERPLSRLPLLTAAERQQAVVEAGAADPGPAPRALHEAVFARAAERPEAVAVAAGSSHLSYGELAARARRLAGSLAGLGVGPEDPVPLFLARDPELVTAILGVLAAGGAYVPLDPAYPPARIAEILADARAPLLLTRSELAERLPAGAPARPLLLDRPDTWPAGSGAGPAGPAGPDSLAYLIYTSGSTGRPKGVAIRHGSAAARVAWSGEAFSAKELSAVLAATSVSFDLSVFELFAPLAAGGTVVLVDDALALADAPGRDRVRLVNTVPSALAELLALGALPESVATVCLAGEPLRRSLVERIAAVGTVVRVLDLYGPSEDTTYSTGASILGTAGEPAIGRPLPGSRALVAGPGLEPRPLGAPGEIVLGGAGLARGYLGRPSATAEVFVPDPFSDRPGERLYRTGDLGRRRPDGGLDFLGRLDHQVKLRGFRIELGEVEATLLRHPAVREAAVLPGREGAGGWQPATGGACSALLACVVAVAEPPPGPADLASFLAERLPRYMVPGAWSFHDALPRTPSGKVDRRALAAAARPAPGPAPDAVPSAAGRSPVEEILAGIWEEVLGVSGVAREDDFFERGGHSLLATRVVSRMRGALGVEVPVRQLFETPTLGALIRAVEALRRAGAGAPPPVRPAPRDRPLPLSFAQERLWFLERLEPGSAFYDIPGAVRIDGAVSAGVLARVIAELGRRHEALRTTFGDRGGRPFQVVAPAPAGDQSLRVADVSALPEARRGAALTALATAEARRPYDLARGPLLRAVLVRLAAEDHALLLNVHHIVSDGWSNAVLLTEIQVLYDAFSRGEPSPLPPLPVQYADFAVWQREWLAGPVLEEQLAYWRGRLAGVSGLELPADRPRPPVERFRGANLSFVLPEDLSLALQDLARRRGATLFAVLLAAWKVLMLRVTGQEDVPVGSPVANRTRTELEGVVGFFVNTLVLRAPLAGDPPFEELVDRVQRVALEAYGHQDLPFERLVEELAPERDMSRNPLFQVMCVLQNQPWPEPRLGAARLAPLYLDTGTAKFDLTLFWQDWEGRLHGLFEFNTDLFERATAEHLARYQRALLRAAVAAPRTSLSALPLLAPAERHQLVAEWNDTAVPGADPLPVHRRVALQAGRTPDAVAAVFGGRHLTYRELLARARRLARGLGRRGVGPERLVGICTERSLEMVVALLAVLEAGGAAVALDPTYPEERLSFIVREAGLAALLTDGRMAALFPGHRSIQVRLDPPGGGEPFPEEEGSDLGVEVSPDHPIYAIYTSGSTGRPKGILVPHRAFAALLDWQLAHAPLARRARTLQASTFGFCVSFQEVFAAWAAGATLVVPDEPTRRDVAGLTGLLEREGIERLHLPFAALKHLAEAAAGRERLPARLREVITAGEQLQVTPAVARLFERLPEGCTLHNQYGASETHVVTALTLGGSPDGWPAIPSVGRPVARVRVHLLDRRLEPVPAGVPGELYAAGPCAPRGYLADPRLTAEKVVPDPWGPPGARLYRTGDSARYLADGRIEYHGRIDTQVKIRGFRVELGEIDTVLSAHPGVQDLAAVARRPPGGEARIVAYLVPAPGAPAGLAEELRDLARRRLPEYMVPAAFVGMAALPLNANGKLDQAALPEPELGRRSGRPRAAPRTPVEEVLAGIWARVLARPADGLSVDDDFFELGGHSLLATQVVAEVRAALGTELPLRRLFEHPTLEGLAGALLEEEARAGGASAGGRIPRRPRDTDRFPVSFSQLREWILDRFEPGASVYNIAVPLRLQGALAAGALERSLRRIVARHEALRTRFLATSGEPLQVVSPRLALPLPRMDLAYLPAPRAGALARELARREGERSFDLTRGPLLRAALLALDAAEHWLLLTFHHSVADGWSMGVVARELAACYREEVTGEPAELPELPIQYPDFAAWQRERLTGDTLAALAGYWRDRLAGSTGELDLPTDRPRPTVRSAAGGVLPVRLPAALVDRLRALARERGASLFMTVLAGFDALFHRYTGQDDLSVGSFIANRNRAEVRDLVGFFVNTLVLRADLSGDPSFGELVERVREVTLGAYAHQDLPFEKLLELLAVPRDQSRTPLFQAMLVLQNLPIGRLGLAGVTLELVEIERRHSDFDLTLWLWEVEGGLSGHLDFAAVLFDRTTARRWMRHLEALLEAASRDPGARLSELSFLAAAERHQLLAEWQDRPGPAPDAVAADRRVEARAARSPDAVAVVAGRDHWTYRALEDRAERVARRLRRLGVAPDAVVAVAAERTPAVLAALLAVSKAGGAFLPVDPDLPAARVEYQLRDSGARALLAPAAALGRFTGLARAAGVAALSLEEAELALPEAAAPPADAALPPEPPPDALAYLLYTSGSTGEPKGVEVTRRGLGSYVGLGAAGCPLGPDDRVLQFAALTFDTAYEEIFPCLAAGGTLVLRGAEPLAPAGLLALAAAERITVLDPPTAYWHGLVAALPEAPLPPSVRLVLVGGEAMSAEAVAAWRRAVDPARVRLVNGYGPTEATVVVAAAELGRDDDPPGKAPIGRPLADGRVHLLDRYGRPVPPGARGEVHAAGAGLARGYRGRPGLTARAFVPDPFSGLPGVPPGGRLYATGDLARWLPDGRLEYLGRRDAQVKVRGFRIELGEIEGALARHPAVAEAVVAARRDGAAAGDPAQPARLVAYVVRRDGDGAGVAELRAHLGELLPSYMMPAVFVFLDALPLTRHGKVDRRALPAPAGERPDLEAGYAPPASGEERVLAGLWREVLGLERVGVHDNFFELGGDSLALLRLHGRLAELGREVPVLELFRYPTVHALAGRLEGGGGEAAAVGLAREHVRSHRQDLSRRRRRLRELRGRERA